MASNTGVGSAFLEVDQALGNEIDRMKAVQAKIEAQLDRKHRASLEENASLADVSHRIEELEAVRDLSESIRNLAGLVSGKLSKMEEPVEDADSSKIPEETS